MVHNLFAVYAVDDNINLSQIEDVAWNLDFLKNIQGSILFALLI